MKSVPFQYVIEGVGDDVKLKGQFAGEDVSGSMPRTMATQLGTALLAAAAGADNLVITLHGKVDLETLTDAVDDKREALKVFERAVATRAEATTIPLADNGGAMLLDEKRETVKLPNLAVDAGKAVDATVDDNVARWKHACDIGALTVAEVEYLKAQGVDVK